MSAPRRRMRVNKSEFIVLSKLSSGVGWTLIRPSGTFPARGKATGFVCIVVEGKAAGFVLIGAGPAKQGVDFKDAGFRGVGFGVRVHAQLRHRMPASHSERMRALANFWKKTRLMSPKKRLTAAACQILYRSGVNAQTKCSRT